MCFAMAFVMAELPLSLFPALDLTRHATDAADQDTVPTNERIARKRALGRQFDSIVADSMAADSAARTLLPDTAGMDSLQKAIWLHNKLIDDSLYADSLNRERKNGIDAPVEYSAADSMTYEGTSGIARLFGQAHVKYENMDLESDQISIVLDSSLVNATGSVDSAGTKFGTPVFKMGNDVYENDTMAFNFKTKKGLIKNVYTEQDDGFMTSEISKRNKDGEIYLYHGRYTTCDDPHPDFYLAMSRAKVRPGKDVVFGPTYLVVADVPLPFAIPYGFFPFTKSYSSGFIMPTYGDEMSKGFYLRDGGYYFAISDKMDLKLLGEIYTKGSWGVSVASNYQKRYRHSGQFLFSYLSSVEGDKNIDYTKTTSFKIQWSHRQDAKANPHNTLQASVNFATTSYEPSNLSSLYNPQALTQSLRTSSVYMSTTFSSIGMTLGTNIRVEQNMRDSTLALTLPNLDISIPRFYPFKRKKAAGEEKWYEKISMQYTGTLTNTINTKEDRILKSSLTKDWRNGMEHKVPINANFTLFKYLTVNPNLTLTDRMLTQKYKRSWDVENQKEVVDTLQGFYNVWDWNFSTSLNTTLYGFYVPSRKIFGDKIQAIRHVFKPSVSFSYHPDFSSSRYGYYDSYDRIDANGNVTPVEYSYYQGAVYSPPGKGMSGSTTFTLSNNLEMKLKSDEDSTGFKKISLIDDLTATMSYNFAAEKRPWSDLNVNLRLKLTKSYTFSMNATFATYAYEADSVGATPYIGEHTEYSRGRFGRFQGMSQTLRLNLDNKKVADFFKWLRGEKVKKKDEKKDEDEDYDTGVDSNIDSEMEAAKHGAKRDNNEMAETDEDGYMLFSLPWSLRFSYGINMRENTAGDFNYDTMRYPYKFTQNLNVSGNIRISDGWDIAFSSGYDFEAKKISMTTASLSRDLHCFNMSCQVTLAPYTSYNFSFRCNAATLTDALKYDKRSSISNAVQWY